MCICYLLRASSARCVRGACVRVCGRAGGQGAGVQRLPLAYLGSLPRLSVAWLAAVNLTLFQPPHLIPQFTMYFT